MTTLRQKAQQELDRIPSWAKILIGCFGIFALFKWTPIVPIVQTLLMFGFWMLVVPLMVAASLGLIGQGTLDMILAQYNLAQAKLASRPPTAPPPPPPHANGRYTVRAEAYPQ